VVITDLRMPKSHGHALAVNLHSLPNRPETIVLSGNAEPCQLIDLKVRGIEDIWFTPVDYEKLATRLRSMVDALSASACNSTSPDM
jgi:FixJ family two-component response regulator